MLGTVGFKLLACCIMGSHHGGASPGSATCEKASQVLLVGQVFFLRVLWFSSMFQIGSARYKRNILDRAVKPQVDRPVYFGVTVHILTPYRFFPVSGQ